ncbi:MAG: hypothetical protein U0835_00145 [Isosphaeraceae bacterium]
MAKVKIHDAVETPSQAIVRAANQVETLQDARGRTIGVKKMGPLDRLKLFEVIGPENSKNEQYVGYAALAFLVASIDGDAVARPSSKLQLEALVQRLDDDGMDAVAQHLYGQVATQQEGDEAALKNGSSTPS